MSPQQSSTGGSKYCLWRTQQGSDHIIMSTNRQEMNQRGNSVTKQLIMALITVVFLNGCMGARIKFETYYLFDVASGKRNTLGKALSSLRKNKIILVGERHHQESHHIAQLLIIRALHDSGMPVAIGLEMFRAESQNALDRWVSGKMSKENFQKVYSQNWHVAWHFYGKILEYAKKEKIPLVALNVPSAITQKVAQEGFQSLTQQEKGELSDVGCRADRDYMAFIRKAYGARAHGQLNFTYFCEAQLVWDNVMAINALKYLKANPEFSMILLAGTGHAWKPGVPEQIRQRSNLLYTVILPHVPGNIEPGIVKLNDCDYIMFGLFDAASSP